MANLVENLSRGAVYESSGHQGQTHPNFDKCLLDGSESPLKSREGDASKPPAPADILLDAKNEARSAGNRAKMSRLVVYMIG